MEFGDEFIALEFELAPVRTIGIIDVTVEVLVEDEGGRLDDEERGRVRGSDE